MPSVQTTFRKLKTGELPVAVWVECVEEETGLRSGLYLVPAKTVTQVLRMIRR